MAEIPTSEDIAAEIKAAEMEIDENIDAANQRLADFIEEQEALFDKECEEVNKQLRINGERLDKLVKKSNEDLMKLAEIKRQMDEDQKRLDKIEETINKNWEKLRKKASFH